ncbi:PREDICTED: organic cation transporter protein-like [Ceratosolen solmsi marchali]|uniref:Organic cation transporter protein-like n=1 Tax=Ceratosolen solmsi marchali TaxID=326594 RepID=A0AAJ6YWU9_9HYME|nr:PREDICTED: organic cation transporter protein-like [Ceratosolen solmsi marchali]
MDAKPDAQPETDPLTKALDKLGEGSPFLWMVFFFTMFPTIFAGMHSNTYIFIAQIPIHWCAVPELTKANWTSDQIRNISSVGSCAKYDYDYSHLAEIGFEESLKYVEKHHETTGTVKCTEYNYAANVERKSMVEEWNLVCDEGPKRATIHMALSLGKMLGAGILGVSADRYGRRGVYALGIVLFVVAGPVSGFVPWYWTFVILRLVTGLGFSAIQFSSLTTLTEVAGNTHRQWMALAFNCGFASGSIFVAGISYLASDWRQVQVATSLPSLILLLFVWFMPESPRWLISQGKRGLARDIIEKFYGPITNYPDDMTLTLESPSSKTNKPAVNAKNVQSNLLTNQLNGLKIIFNNRELQKRTCISYFTWMTASFTYYTLALNVDAVSVNYYLYALLLGVTEIPAYLLPTPVLMVMGRRQASSILFGTSGLLLIVILALPRSQTVAIVSVNLISRFSLSAAYGIMILYASELFPTIARSSALGTSAAMAHVGSIVAPFSVDNLVTLAWWGPSTLCGVLVLGAALACLVLPETRDRPLADSVEEELADSRGSVSWTQVCACSR